MPAIKRERLSGWGLTPVEECVSWRPEKQRDLRLILKEHTGPLLARGLGRSYGDAAIQPSGIIRTERLDHFIEFDTAQGIVRAQAGVTLAELMDLAIPRGWFPPVIPGTRHVTLGGALACNVHGKNHWREGDFAEHVLSIRLMLANGDLLECSPHEHSELFWATAGGMGMTGVIEEITLKLLPITTSSLLTTTFRVNSIEGMVEAFEHYRENADYMVGWIDHMARDAKLGQGVFEAAAHAMESDGGASPASYQPPRRRFSVPFFLPGFAINRYTMALYNKWRFRTYSAERQRRLVDFNGFFHPLDAIGHWNRLYGRRGFFQYQCVIPESPDSAATLREFLTMLQQQKCFSFLAVIKYHRDGKGLLTFPVRGYSIALDFPGTRRVRKLLAQVNRWVAQHNGRIYLAKDAVLTPELFRSMYGEAGAQWCDLIRDSDPGSRFTSLMSERLEWKPRP